MKILYNTTKLSFLEEYYKSFFTSSPQEYFSNPYIFFTKYDSQFLAYNSLTNSFFILTEEDYNNYLNNIPQQDLIENLFLLDINMKESLKEIIDQAITFFEDVFLETERNLRIVVLTTTGCNAQCHYCYEHCLTKEEIKFLDEKTADKIINFAIDYQKKHLRKIDFRWFGGEPLLNYKIINYMCDKLRQNNIRYKSHIITNGVLFDEQMYQETIKHQWNLDKIQITLDGTESEHNRIKNYKDKKINGFQTTINNIKNILNNHEIRIDIRLNLSPTNKEDFLNLISYLKQEKIFYNDKLRIYCNQIFGILEDNGVFNLSNEEKEKFLEDYKEIYEILEETKGDIQLERFQIFNCKSCSGNMLIILPNGDISYCEHHIDNIPITNIDNLDLDKFNEEAINLLRIKQKSIKKDCDKCWRYPICTKIYNCSARDGFCNSIILTKDEYLMTNQLQRLYKKYIDN